jgi:predicted CopG family antitoxin
MAKDVILSDEAYLKLSGLKNENESFSELIMRLTEKKDKKSLSEFAGCWKGDKGEMDRIFKEVDKERHEAKSRDFEL